MKKAWKKLLVVGLAVAMLAGCSKKEDEKNSNTLTAAANIDYAPFEFYEEGVAVGFDVDLWTAICDDLGYEAEFVHYPWDSLVSGLKSGKFDAIVSDMEITEERLKSIDFTDTYFYETIGVAKKAGDPITDLADLKGKVVGLQSGTVGESWAKSNDAIGEKEFTTYETMADAIMDLEVGRTSAVINNGPYMQYQAKINDKMEVMQIIDDEPIKCGIGVAKENDDLKEKINGSLKKLIDNGTYAKLYKKWFGADPSADFMPAE